MDAARHLATFRAQGAALAEVARRDLVPVVPSCPGWTVADLVEHTGNVHRWVTAQVAGEPDAPRMRRDWVQVQPDDGDWPAWLEAGVERLADLLAAEDLERTMDTWAGEQPIAFWCRRMAQETSVHRWDGEAALGPPEPIDEAVAVDGIDELFEVFLPRRLHRAGLPLEGSHTLALLPDGAGTGWHVTIEPIGVSVTEGLGEADAEVRGTASSILLWLWNRRPAEPLEVEGDRGLVDTWHQLLRV